MSRLEDATGLFGPDSVSWRVDREVLVLAGGSCALLMQAAHPFVAAGVVEHSSYRTDPFGRLLRTLTSSFDVVFGSRPRAAATIRRVNAIHAAVRGELPAGGGHYSALDPEALLWVHATLVDTALRVYGRFIAPLSPDEEQAYHREAARVAVLLRVPVGHIPDTIAELRAWMDEMIASGAVHVTPAALEIARTILYPTPWLPRVIWDAAHFISLAMLPGQLREQYGIGWSAGRERGMERVAAITRRALPLIPPPLRFAPHARTAAARVRRAEAIRGGRGYDGPAPLPRP